MLVSTSRYAERGVREFARQIADAMDSGYCARGKKTVETLVSLARKKGENTLALVSGSRISFISVSASGWDWKHGFMSITSHSGAKKAGRGEIEAFEGPQAGALMALFGIQETRGGDTVVNAGARELSFSRDGETFLEIRFRMEKWGENEGKRED